MKLTPIMICHIAMRRSCWKSALKLVAANISHIVRGAPVIKEALEAYLARTSLRVSAKSV